MKTKQLPDDYCDWIKAQTFVIGAETVFEHGSQTAARKASNGWCPDASRVREAIARNPEPIPRFRHTSHSDLQPR
jgi:hypothetical protein